jgi:hypothetical protein
VSSKSKRAEAHPHVARWIGSESTSARHWLLDEHGELVANAAAAPDADRLPGLAERRRSQASDVIANIGSPAPAAYRRPPRIGGVGAGVLLGVGGAIFALGLCAAVPAVLVALRRRSARRPATPELERDGRRA